MYATMEEQWLILIKLKQSEKNKFHHIKKEVVAIFTDFDNEHKFTSAS